MNRQEAIGTLLGYARSLDSDYVFTIDEYEAEQDTARKALMALGVTEQELT